ncbi:hypothetical protein AVEN_160465-1 [Araneus ventricosus]|uniref:Uncharacterized protein n=1 Tax=Araneus ventricosus TaxID=182803 RepID=A0A4Y2U873_ARAVE|nr:hypothetical protein AVEN_160465-1 [Araneus ventricosus]
MKNSQCILQYNETSDEITQKRSVRNEADGLRRARERLDQRRNSLSQQSRTVLHVTVLHGDGATRRRCYTETVLQSYRWSGRGELMP